MDGGLEELFFEGLEVGCDSHAGFNMRGFVVNWKRIAHYTLLPTHVAKGYSRNGAPAKIDLGYQLV